MTHARWSLAAKLVLMGALALALALASIGSTLWLTWQIEGGAAAVQAGLFGAVGHQQAGLGISALKADGRHAGGQGQLGDQSGVLGHDYGNPNYEAIERALLGGVAMVLIGRGRLRASEAERIDRAVAVDRVGGIGVLAEQSAGQTVHRRRERPRVERRFAIGIGGKGIGAEVVIEGNVLLEDHHQVLDWRGGMRVAVAMVSMAETEEAGVLGGNPGNLLRRDDGRGGEGKHAGDAHGQ